MLSGALTKIRLRFQQKVLSILVWVLFGKSCEDIKTILLFRTCVLGDFIMAIPAINKVREKYPNCRIILLSTYIGSRKTRSHAQKYLSSQRKTPEWFDFICPKIVDEVILINSFALSEIKILRKLIKRLDPSLTFILPMPGERFRGLIKKILLLRSLGIKKNVFGYKVTASYSFARERQFKMGLFKHKIFGPIEALKQHKDFCDLDDSIVEFKLDIKSKDLEWAQSIVNQLSSKMIITIAPGGIQAHKQWPIDNYINLIKEINESYSATFILVGTNLDSDIGERLMYECTNCKIINLIGTSSIGQLAAILRFSTVLIGNDGGAMHLGAAVGTKTLTIISGIEYPGSTEPWGQHNRTVRHEVSCSPCYSMTFCPLLHNRCLRELPMRKVFECFQDLVK